ncbi:amidoligase family protein [Streptacidiphilus jiangxiensis]|uniref:Putative amidoligase enzyme n=1 Tax=Streptacidiphilus jiangxiensis TaxID=235985 RepID=A0A1H8APP1_STRJI|nr:amidoligase family protein [Streptacidiphilus jiangxiensis]SEM72476.1 Putative amidoligase enzyme [Streptacidiphilus jiangxiensis]
MGSGSRIDHQHHAVAPSRPASQALTTAPGGVLIEEPPERTAVRLANDVPDGHAGIHGYNINEAGNFVFLPQRLDVIRGNVSEDQDALVELGASVGEGGDRVYLDGDARVTQGPDGRLEVDARGLQCGRGDAGADGPCEHQEAVGRLVQERLNASASTAADRLAAQEVLSEVAAEHAASIAAQEQVRADRAAEPAVTSYAENMDAFDAAYNQAMERRRNGEPLVPYMRENATGGLGTRDGGRAFGVEIEFDFPRSMSPSQQAVAKEAIAREMHEAGLSPDPHVHGWHASAREGYTDAPNAWRMEFDSTVAGEIVSPILYDEPQTWDSLAQVCEIVRRHGGTASQRTGGHVHVAVPDFDHTVENHNQLINTVAGYEDVMYRLAHNPGSRQHRGLRWCQPNTRPSSPYTSVGAARAGNNSHGIGLNLQSVTGNRSDHAEFRMWDGSLDPGVIQAQVNVSLGMANAALRDAGRTAAPAPEPVGSHQTALAREGMLRRRLTGERWEQNTRSFRNMVDHLFARNENRAQVTALFAGTRWHRGA